MDAFEVTLLFDTYGGMLTDKQREYLDMCYNQDMSLGEIAQELQVSRQGVYDNLSRAEALLKNMEEKTGCVRRDLQYRKAIRSILDIAEELAQSEDPQISDLAGQIKAQVQGLEE